MYVQSASAPLLHNVSDGALSRASPTGDDFKCVIGWFILDVGHASSMVWLLWSRPRARRRCLSRFGTPHNTTHIAYYSSVFFRGKTLRREMQEIRSKERLSYSSKPGDEIFTYKHGTRKMHETVFEVFFSSSLNNVLTTFNVQKASDKYTCCAIFEPHVLRWT